jgi:hypothetical protein
MEIQKPTRVNNTYSVNDIPDGFFKNLFLKKIDDYGYSVKKLRIL